MITKIIDRFKKENSNELGKVFYELEQSSNSPYNMALHSLNELKRSARGSEELFLYLIEDAIFISLYATFYEELMKHIVRKPENALIYIERFSSASEERERLIAAEAQNHLNFIENLGLCSGCNSCDNHADVGELIAPYQRGDIDFFTELYLGMQTIQYSMEALLYDIIPNKLDLAKEVSPQNILAWRQLIYSYVQLKAGEV